MLINRFSYSHYKPFKDPDLIFIFEAILSVTQAGFKLASLGFLTSLLPPYKWWDYRLCHHT